MHDRWRERSEVRMRKWEDGQSLSWVILLFYNRATSCFVFFFLILFLSLLSRCKEKDSLFETQSSDIFWKETDRCGGKVVAAHLQRDYFIFDVLDLAHVTQLLLWALPRLRELLPDAPLFALELLLKALLLISPFSPSSASTAAHFSSCCWSAACVQVRWYKVSTYAAVLLCLFLSILLVCCSFSARSSFRWLISCLQLLSDVWDLWEVSESCREALNSSISFCCVWRSCLRETNSSSLLFILSSASWSCFFMSEEEIFPRRFFRAQSSLWTELMVWSLCWISSVAFWSWAFNSIWEEDSLFCREMFSWGFQSLFWCRSHAWRSWKDQKWLMICLVLHFWHLNGSQKYVENVFSMSTEQQFTEQTEGIGSGSGNQKFVIAVLKSYCLKKTMIQ